jgi:hypothetical protein
MNLNDPTASSAITSTSPYPGDAKWLEAHWMPFTANRNFKSSGAQAGRMLVSAQGAYYRDNNGPQNSGWSLRLVVLRPGPWQGGNH